MKIWFSTFAAPTWSKKMEVKTKSEEICSSVLLLALCVSTHEED